MELPVLTEKTVRDYVLEDYRTAQVFEHHGFDFCCGGAESLEQACRERGLNTDDLLRELTEATRDDLSATDDYRHTPLDELIDYILQTHHTYVKRMLPVIAAHLRRVVDSHAKNHPYVVEVARTFSNVTLELESHLMKEEVILFPRIVGLVRKIKRNELSISGPVDRMVSEHEIVGDELARIRTLTNNYQPPVDACATFRTTLLELKDFEQDLHRHVFIENSILFPRAIELYNKLQEGSSDSLVQTS